MKRESSTIWKKILIISLALLTIAIIVFGSFMLVRYEQNKPGAACDEVLYKNERIEIIGHYKNWTKQYSTMRDAVSGKTIIRRFRWFANSSNPNDSIVVICDWNNKRGYINRFTGERVIPAQYTHAWNFSEGLGAVVRNHRVGFINMQGEEVIPCQFAAGVHSMNRLGFAFHDGLCVMTNERNQCGIINRQGEWVVEPQYDCIWNTSAAGLRIFQNEGLYGLMDAQGHIVQTARYDGLIDYGDFYEVEKDGIRFTMGYDLQIIQSFVCDRFEVITYTNEDCDYITTPYLRYFIGEKEGVIDKNGHVVIPAKYDIIWMIDFNLFKANMHNTNLWVLLDNNGQEVPITKPI